MQMINGFNFLLIAESIAAMCLSRYVKVTSDIIVAKFNNNTIYSYPNGTEATFLDILNDLRDEFWVTVALAAHNLGQNN